MTPDQEIPKTPAPRSRALPTQDREPHDADDLTYRREAREALKRMKNRRGGASSWINGWK